MSLCFPLPRILCSKMEETSEVVGLLAKRALEVERER